MGANANFTIFNGFSLKNQIIQNQYNAEADQVEILRAKNELRISVTLAYMQVLMNQELAKIAQEQILNIQSQYARVKALVNEGNMPKTNLIDLDAQLATAEFDALNAKNTIEISKLSLAQLMAFPNFTSFEMENFLEEKNTLINDNYLQNMLSSADFQPIIKSAELRVKSANIGIKLAEAGKYPSVSLGAGLGSAYSSAASKEYNYFNQLGLNLNQFARLSINIPIFTNGQVQGRIVNAQINQKIIEVQLSQTKLQLKQEIERAYLTTKIAQEKMIAAQKQISAQQIELIVLHAKYAKKISQSTQRKIERFFAFFAKNSANFACKFDLFLEKV